jgi:hypothetical protein
MFMRGARRRSILLYTLTGFAVAAACPSADLLAGDPVQWWNAFASELSRSRRMLEARGESRLSEGGDVNTWNAEGHLLLRAGERFSWGPGYKYQQQRSPGGKFADEHRFVLTGKAKLGEVAAWKASLRARYEYRDREDRPRSWRIRLRPEVWRALGGAAWSLSISDEIFYDSAVDRYAQNRVQVGFERPLREGVVLTLYYMLRSDRQNGHWEETQVLGSVWKFD